MALTDFKVFDTSVREKTRIKRVSSGKFVLTGGCVNSRFAAHRYLRVLAFIESSSGTIKLSGQRDYNFDNLIKLTKGK